MMQSNYINFKEMSMIKEKKINQKNIFNLFIALIIIFNPDHLVAQELDSGDTAWILTSTALVLFMTLPGLALFYGGLVRVKNILCLLYTSPSPRDQRGARMPSSA